MIFLAGQVKAEYVSDNLKITARTGPGTGNKIITMLEAGQKVEVLQTSSGWSQVKLPEGSLGWVLTRFLTTDEPCRHILSSLEKEYTELQQELADLKKQSAPLFEENKRLKEESKEQFTQLAEQTKQVGKLKNDLNNLKQHQGFQWFFAGAGVLLLGFVLGFFTKRRRRASSSY